MEQETRNFIEIKEISNNTISNLIDYYHNLSKKSSNLDINDYESSNYESNMMNSYYSLPKNLINYIKIKTNIHNWNILNITAKHPVLLELCSYEDLNKAIIKAGGDPSASEVQINTISELP